MGAEPGRHFAALRWSQRDRSRRHGGIAGIISPEMTQEVSVQTSNFGADAQYGPVVVSAISKSGTANYHGEAYFDARNDILNANDWQDNHQGIARGNAHYYYPGGNAGGPIPFTRKKLFIWGGYERFLQNQGNANVLKSFIPSPEMMAGDFTSDNADNQALCPGGFSAKTQGQWCNDLTGTILPDGTTVTTAISRRSFSIRSQGDGQLLAEGECQSGNYAGRL